MELLREYFTPWIISNSIAILFLLAAIWKPRLARLLFALLFAWACWINYTTSHATPESYLEYAKFSPVGLYKDFINGWFSRNITPMITVIAVGQGIIAIAMALKGFFVRLACFGAIIFFLGITPFGVGSAFPAPLISIATLIIILKKDHLNYLWKK